ncbi:hypothetical protein DYB28_007469 [Aphanomyces astaci]|uniref:Uncharacterized protein n=1 Tax=Aphanomyces astaci TaxID=112090 RepID=A0A397EH73_APHAT|nr:hypothetical protein DYB31_003315 [Aphanomyces astaci]RHZ11556.1 hypothetical protein DYB26_008290 [Aphanomyces astaci]RLO08865.1 hypothetical protein DYB28_007469 [Aphanomyces astaci]
MDTCRSSTLEGQEFPRLADGKSESNVSVMRSTDLLALITSYQTGVLEEMVALSAVLKRRRFLLDLRKDFDEVAAVVEPWYRQYRTSRLDYLASCLPGHATGNLLIWAAASGSVDVVRWFVEGCHASFERFESSLDEAVAYGQVEVVQYLAQHIPLDKNSRNIERWNVAAQYGHLNMVEWLDAHNVGGCTRDVGQCAAWMGHLDIVQWVHVNRPERCSASECMVFAALNGHVEVVRWLDERSPTDESAARDAMETAARHGYVDVVRLLHTNHARLSTIGAMQEAKNNGHLHVVKFLQSPSNLS